MNKLNSKALKQCTSLHVDQRRVFIRIQEISFVNSYQSMCKQLSDETLQDQNNRANFYFKKIALVEDIRIKGVMFFLLIVWGDNNFL